MTAQDRLIDAEEWLDVCERRYDAYPTPQNHRALEDADDEYMAARFALGMERAEARS